MGLNEFFRDVEKKSQQKKVTFDMYRVLVHVALHSRRDAAGTLSTYVSVGRLTQTLAWKSLSRVERQLDKLEAAGFIKRALVPHNNKKGEINGIVLVDPANAEVVTATSDPETSVHEECAAPQRAVDGTTTDESQPDDGERQHRNSAADCSQNDVARRPRFGTPKYGTTPDMDDDGRELSMPQPSIEEISRQCAEERLAFLAQAEESQRREEERRADPVWQQQHQRRVAKMYADRDRMGGYRAPVRHSPLVQKILSDLEQEKQR